MNGDLSNLKCSRCGIDTQTWLVDGQALCYVCAATSSVSQDVLETRARKAFVPKGHPEQDWQNTVVALLEAYGYSVYHSRPARTGRMKDGKEIWNTPYQGKKAKGFPDVVAIKDGRGIGLSGRGIAWELKAGKNKATPEQEEWLNLFALTGFHTGVYYPDDFEELKNLLEGM